VRRGHCDDCGSQRPFRRAFGWGTFFAVLPTFGGWLLALPFYPLRCTQCGRKWSEQETARHEKEALTRRPRTVKDWSVFDWIGMSLFGVLMLVLLVALVRGGFR
jgi:hypothetical protein